MNYTDSDLLELYSNPEFYDIEFASRNYEIPFYNGILESISGKVLEIACGTGRITLKLAKNSSNKIYGSDISPEMIGRAKEKVKKSGLNVEFFVEDFRKTNGNYDLIICVTNAFQHVLTSDDALQVLKSVYHSLNEKGYFVFDIQNPDLKKLSADLTIKHKYKEFVMNGELVEAYISGSYDAIAQIYFFTIEYLVKGKEIFRKKVAMRMFFPQESQMLINVAGFKIIHSYGDFDKSPLTSNSSKQIYVLQKV